MIEEYKLKIKELEEERKRLVSELEQYLESGKQKERQIFNQQLKLQKFENEIEVIKSEDTSKMFEINDLL